MIVCHAVAVITLSWGQNCEKSDTKLTTGLGVTSVDNSVVIENQARVQRPWAIPRSSHAAGVLALFDADQNGTLEQAEMRLDSPEKIALITSRLESSGLINPRIVSEIQPYNITHGVVPDTWAVRDCQTCHSENSRLNQPIVLANAVPNDVLPAWVNAPGVFTEGSLT